MRIIKMIHCNNTSKLFMRDLSHMIYTRSRKKTTTTTATTTRLHISLAEHECGIISFHWMHSTDFEIEIKTNWTTKNINEFKYTNARRRAVHVVAVGKTWRNCRASSHSCMRARAHTKHSNSIRKNHWKQFTIKRSYIQIIIIFYHHHHMAQLLLLGENNGQS